MEMLKKLKLHNISKDLLYSVAGLCLMNGVIQFAVNPYLQSRMGSERFGVMLSLISVLSVLSISFGTSFNYSRVLASTKKHDCNSDYFLMLIMSVAVIIPVCIVSQIIIDKFAIAALVGYIILTVFTTFRYYGDVNFRLDVNFRGFFAYYAIMAAGYLAGIALYGITHSWIIAYMMGEAAAVVFVAIRGRIFRCNPFRRSEFFADHLKSSGALFVSNLITSLLANFDRPFILMTIDANSVTVFYAATLIGKVIALLTTPLNGVVISYLAKYDGKISKRIFTYLFAAALAGTAAISLVCILASFPFVKLMYPNVYEEAKPLIPVAIIGQVFFFISGTLMVVLLRFTEEKLQYIINGIYFVIYIFACIIGAKVNGLAGFAAGILIANFSRLLLAYIFALLKIDDNKKRLVD